MSLRNEEKRKVLQSFFKLGEGQYGQGDRFLGVIVPLTREVARRNKNANCRTIECLLQSEWHEIRLCALFIMVEKMKTENEKERKRLFDLYLSNTQRINNWDLVDMTAPQIVGGFLKDKQRSILYKLAESELLWDNRIAIVATSAFIKDNDLDDTFALAVKLLHHTHDLIHKATGWMLREAGKQDIQRLRSFVYERHAEMPRTMLRYAIEKFPKEERKEILSL